MRFDFHKLNHYSTYIKYFLGQLYRVHEHHVLLSIGEGSIDFTGKKWTDDNRAVLALYYMAIGNGLLDPFYDIQGSSKTPLTKLLYPTFPYDHPDFDIKRAKLPLKN